MSKWERRIRATSRGIIRLWPQIKRLRESLTHLEKAQLRLINTKWDAQRHIVPVKVIKAAGRGPRRHTVVYEEQQLTVALSRMTPEKRAEFIERLQGEL